MREKGHLPEVWRRFLRRPLFLAGRAIIPLRTTQFSEGCYYHLYNRGVNRQSIFLDERDYFDFLLRVKKPGMMVW